MNPTDWDRLESLLQGWVDLGPWVADETECKWFDLESICIERGRLRDEGVPFSSHEWRDTEDRMRPFQAELIEIENLVYQLAPDLVCELPLYFFQHPGGPWQEKGVSTRVLLSKLRALREVVTRGNATGVPPQLHRLAALTDPVWDNRSRTAVTDSGLSDATTLAAELELSVKKVRTFLTRYAEKHGDCRVENPTPRRGEPRFTYRRSDVLPALRNHFGL